MSSGGSDLPKSVEHWDRRLAPGQSYVMRRQFQSGQLVTLRIDVVPRDRYEKDLRIQLAAAQQVPGHVFLGTVQRLLEHEMSLRYRLVDMSVPVPPEPGIVQRVLKEGRDVTNPANP